MVFKRRQEFKELRAESCVLWGPRQTGKSTLLRNMFPRSPVYDLLRSDLFFNFTKQPSLLREEILGLHDKSLPVIVDEIQKVPALLDEIHWLIENEKIRFVLSGSSPRKIIRSGGNMLGGRLVRYELHPLVYPEIPDFDLIRALNNGLLPKHYLSASPRMLTRSYIGDYLQEEIMQEAFIRKVPSFSRFLEMAAFSNGEIINYSNIARDCGVSMPSVKEYFQILSDTLVGKFIYPYQKRPKRRIVLAPKFYYFDVGVANALLNRGRIEMGSELFGKAFEQFFFQELTAHSHYSQTGYPVTYWRTSSQLEVDFILGNNEVAVEIKGTHGVNASHLSGLKAFMEEYKVKQAIIISLDERPRVIGKISVLPWRHFLEKLWSGEIIK